ncbi:MGDG synthase family glycosyltransferase [Peribacillus huizhouensis]|uniref:Processive 1,2-diacylglycerol beta-glucosyltransferase n=1 Tax=Peribacillus huizhouensis TaxID=1501239 RepID=A0ABR6CQD7_9BACI|nr:glycosyltransferase [Peribacillus huizhouensis]MBA9027131.1 processive 1,2-diacylglycerol beta-glucosyltransferase [Peribacillus huizhouensis]
MRRPSALILTAHYGNGHLQVANVIATELKQKGFEPIVSDLFGESYPAFSTFTQSLLVKSVSYRPSFYKWFYYGTKKVNSKGLSQFSRYLGRKRLQELINDHLPYFIITTFPLHAAPFLSKRSGFFIPTYTVITDYCIHPYWINPLIDHYFAGSDSVKSSLLNQYIKDKCITVSGIPIRPEFEMHIDKRTYFQKHNFNQNKKVITVLAGALGVLKNVKELCQLLVCNPSYYVVAVCGKNNNLYEKILPLAIHFPESFRLFGYEEKVYELMAISDCLITKPGGITLTEASALQIPLILYNPVPGQESENARHFEKNGAALISHTIAETVHHVHELSSNEESAQSMKRALHKIHKPQSSTLIADFAINRINRQNSVL